MVGIKRIGALTAASLLSFAGCATEGDGSTSTEAGTAQITILDDAKVAASARVVAKLLETGAPAGEALISLEGKAAAEVKLSLLPGTYLVDVAVFADVDAKVLLGSKSSIIEVDVGLITKVDLKIGPSGPPGPGGATGLDLGLDLKVNLGAKVGIGGTPSTPGAPATPAGGAISLDLPIIESIDVRVGLTTVKIDLKVKAAVDAALTFAWAGAGITGTITGTASIEVPIAAILGGSLKDIKVVVQTDLGAAVMATIKLDVVTGLLGALKLSGIVTTVVDTLTNVLDLGLKDCVDAHAKCTTACRTAAAAGTLAIGCLLECAVDLVTCPLN